MGEPGFQAERLAQDYSPPALAARFRLEPMRARSTSPFNRAEERGYSSGCSANYAFDRIFVR